MAYGLALFGALHGSRAQADAAPGSCLSAHEHAQVARLHGHLVASREELLACAQSACPRVVRDDCSGWLAEVERALPSLVFAVDDGAGHDLNRVRISVGERVIAERADGRAVPLDPGVHTLRFEAPDYEPHTQEFTVREGEKQRLIHVSLARAAGARSAASPTDSVPTLAVTPPRVLRLRRASGVLAGLGVASLVAGTAFAIRGQRMANHCDRAVPENETSSCSHAFYRHGRRAYVLADAGFAAGGALLGVAAVTLWRALRLGRGAHPAEEAPPLAASVDRHGILLALTWPASL